MRNLSSFTRLSYGSSLHHPGRQLKINSGLLLIAASLFIFTGCSSSKKSTADNKSANKGNSASRNTGNRKNIPAVSINTRNVSADDVVAFAETLIGVKYAYGSAVKEKGFDCSGFITYVFSHFGINVPRTSVEFTNAGKEVSLDDARKGDLILFTGSNASSGIVGHMGIITQNKKGRVMFIHSASGNGKGVMVSDMNSYFTPRFIKVIRVFH